MGSVDGLFLQLTKALHLQITGGSSSIRATGVHGMRVAGAAAREMLLAEAALAWKVPVDTLQTKEGKIIHRATGKQAAFAEFAVQAGRKAPPAQPKLKAITEFSIMGQSKPRHDIPAKVDGSAEFGIDVVVEGMKYAAITAAPVFGGSLNRLDAAKAETMPGVLEVVDLGNAVAVVAEGFWQAKTALASIDITWGKTASDDLDSDAIFAQFQRDINAAKETGESHEDLIVGDPVRAAEQWRVVERQYTVPYLAHACMEPMNAVASVVGDSCEIWTGSQNPLGFRYDVAAALDLDPDNVSFHNYFMGGGFGRRSVSDVAIQAAQISRQVGLPVKLIWSREEDTRQDYYRPAVMSEFRAGLDQHNRPVSWENIYVDKHEPAEAPHIPYAIENQKIHFVDSPTHVPFGPWRSVDHSQHGFFTESFVDELAYEAAQDPYQFRRDMLSGHPRLLAALDLVAEKSQWHVPIGKGRGRGIALQESFGTVVAEVVEVTVQEGQVKVDRVVIAVDPGFAVSPDGLKAQMESGVVYGLTAALYGEVSIHQGRVSQGNFDTYNMLRMPQAPVIETHIINSGASWGGAGEPGVPGTAPALTNAIYAATGTRVRDLPVSKYEFDVEFREENNLSS
jgi:isoquinoline 1-oxidoreductase beta subunit